MQPDDRSDDDMETSTDSNQCPFCDFVAPSKNDLVEHHKKKHKDKPPSLFKCDSCDFIHKKNKNVREHSQEVHGKKFFAYQCQSCNKQMMKFVSYRNHVKTACKTNIRKEQKTCELCVIEFSSKQELKKHKIEKHMSNKLYCCPHCDYKAKHNWQALQVNMVEEILVCYGQGQRNWGACFMGWKEGTKFLGFATSHGSFKSVKSIEHL